MYEAGQATPWPPKGLEAPRGPWGLGGWVGVGLGFQVLGLGSRVSKLGFEVWGLGSEVLGLGFEAPRLAKWPLGPPNGPKAPQGPQKAP